MGVRWIYRLDVYLHVTQVQKGIHTARDLASPAAINQWPLKRDSIAAPAARLVSTEVG